MKLAFIVPNTHTHLLTKLVGQFSQIEITPIIYDAIFDIPFCIEGRQQEFDQLLFLGETAKLYTGSLTLATKEKRCEASKMAYFFVNFSIFFLSNV